MPLETEPLSEELMKRKEQSLKDKVTNKLKQNVYHWEPIHYDTHKGILYVIARLGSDFAVMKKVFAEVMSQHPTFKPKTLFDFGSGIGTTLWAAHEFWAKSLVEHFCVDSSADMNNLNRLLLQDGKEEGSMFLKGVSFRQFLPASDLLKYDLVVSAYSLMELPSSEARLRIVDILWRKTHDMLVLVEKGTKFGYRAVVEARDYIMHISAAEAKLNPSLGTMEAKVLAPCPHELACPKMAYSGEDALCSFEVTYHSVFGKKSSGEKEKFSYVVLRKSHTKADHCSWPRLVRPVLRRPRHTVCRMCCSDGDLHEVIFTKAKHDRVAYRCARASNWGDQLPVDVYASQGLEAELLSESEVISSDDEPDSDEDEEHRPPSN